MMALRFINSSFLSVTAATIPNIFSSNNLKNLFFYSLLIINFKVFAQFPMGGGKGMNMNMGRFYGKVIDSTSGKPIEFAVVQLYGNKMDTATKKYKYGLLAGELTKANGEFNLEQLPVFGDFTLKITAISFAPIEKKVSFNFNMDNMRKQGNNSREGGFNTSALNAIDKDLGNFKMRSDAKQLKEVVVDGGEPIMEIKMDKKIFNVEKNLTTVGGTAEDVLKMVPSVSVDMDGNVSVRNSSPQLFIDGRPTTMTIDQIPADAIQSVEVITNPSAKYDASGGMAGILNIVLKKNRKIGYNGTIRAGVDMRGMLNGGGDINAREGKINLFASAFLNQRKSIAYGYTDRDNLFGYPHLSTYQRDSSINPGFFGFLRGGADWFINNRNTLTLSGQMGWADFQNRTTLTNRTDSNYATYSNSSTYIRQSLSKRSFKNGGASLLYKHLFPREGKELTADINYNQNFSNTGGDYKTNFYDGANNLLGPQIEQMQKGGGGSMFLTAQTDLIQPLSAHMKIETGVRGAYKSFVTRNDNFIYNSYTGEYEKTIGQSTNYNFNDQVYAAYLTFSHEYKKISYNIGLRFESSFYEGTLLDSNQKFSIQYPITPFPSAFLSWHMTSKTDLQVSYSRRVNRPGFMQLIPIMDYSDSLNLRRGNPNLNPEFTNSAELNILHNFNRTNNIMLQMFYKYNTGLITSYQTSEYDAVYDRNVVITTYENANFSNSYGVEVTSKNSIKKWLDFTTNVNIYNNIINAGNIEAGLKNENLNWFAKLNATFKLPKSINIQLTGEYFSKTNTPMGGGGGGGRWGGMGGGMGMGGMGMGGMGMGGGGHFGGGGATTQGYTAAFYVVDVGVKMDLLKDKNLTLNLNASDIIKSRIIATHTESSFFTQDSEKRRDQLFFRFSVSYRFGKFDVSIFKRKNLKMNMDGMDMGM